MFWNNLFCYFVKFHIKQQNFCYISALILLHKSCTSVEKQLDFWILGYKVVDGTLLYHVIHTRTEEQLTAKHEP